MLQVMGDKGMHEGMACAAGWWHVLGQREQELAGVFLWCVGLVELVMEHLHVVLGREQGYGNGW